MNKNLTAICTDDFDDDAYDAMDYALAGLLPGAPIKSKQGLDFIPITIHIDDIKSACSHRWVDIGFAYSKWACYYCGIDKP